MGASAPTGAALAPLALTMGDPAGIGLDITLEAWQRRDADALTPFCFYGDARALYARAKKLGFDVPLALVSEPRDALGVFAGALPVIDIVTGVPVVAGQPSSENASAVIAAITRAVEDVRAGHARAVVTNPIAKSVLYEGGFKHPGHTEFLAELAAKYWPGQDHQPVMMLACETLKVVPLTIHVPLSVVPSLVTRGLIQNTVRICTAAMRRDFLIAKPRIAVAGLNPHAGESGAIGREDIDVIAPAIASLAVEGFDVIGPLPADTMFHAAARKSYDAAICMYHDQALIPIKTLAFDEGVNVTLGLPFIRTSPDHGTAFGVAGSGTASAKSLIEALKLAGQMSARRAVART